MSKARLFEILASAIFIAVVFLSYDVESALKNFLSLRTDILCLAFLAILGSLAFSFARFRAAVALFGFRPSASDMARAFIVGQFSNQFLANIFGQSISRATLLHQCGVPFSVTIFATWVERVLALSMLLFFSIAGAALFLGNYLQITKTGIAYLSIIVIGCTVSLVIVCGVAIWRFGASVLGTWPRQRVMLACLLVTLTAATHSMMLLAYTFCLWSLDVNPWRIEVSVALLIVMLVASLPISFAGWGLRELSAAQVLAFVGISAPVGIATGVMVGLLSMISIGVLAVLLVLAALGGLPKSSKSARPRSAPTETADWDRTLLTCPTKRYRLLS